MPYIKYLDRVEITSKHSANAVHEHGEAIIIREIETAGELQYAIALMIKDYIKRKGLNYQHCNDIMGALAGAQMEFYRRTVAPYEDKKIEENGDV